MSAKTFKFLSFLSVCGQNDFLLPERDAKFYRKELYSCFDARSEVSSSYAL